MSPRTKRALLVLGAVVGFAALVFVVLVRPTRFVVQGPAMEPTLRDDESVLLRRRRTGILPPAEVRPGDLVVAVSPADGVLILKRVLAVGGQRVEMRAGRTFVDGRALAGDEVDCPEISDPSANQRCWREHVGERTWIATASDYYDDEHAERVVPAGHLHLRGDRRDRSNDSTNPSIGDVPLGRVVALGPL